MKAQMYLFFSALLLLGTTCSAQNVNIIINNNAQQGYSSNVMCTVGGGICANGRQVLMTSGMRYVSAPSRAISRRAKEKERLSYLESVK